MELSTNVVPLRRRNNLNKKVTTLNLYHKTTLLKDVEKALTEAGGNELLSRFRDGPFGHFVGWRPGQSNAQVLHSILCRAIDEDGGMFFWIKGSRIEFTAADFALVTGLQFGESSWDPNKHLNANQSRLHKRLCRKDLKLGRELLGLINTNPKRFQNDQDTLLSLVNLLIANTFILGHDIKNAPFAWLWRLADDPEEFNRFPWGAYSFLTLRYYVQHAVDSDAYHFYGPAWALIVWGYEVIGGITQVAGVLDNNHSYPRCLRWKFGKSLQTTLEQFFRIVDDTGYVMCNIAPDQWEVGLPYFQSTYVANPLDVFFYVPVAVTGEPSQFPPEARTRRPMHDQDDILDGDEGRPRRSTQSRRYMGEEEQTSARGSRPRRDPGKRPREDTSSGSRGHDIPNYATPEEVRRIMKEEIAEQNAEIDRKLEGFMDRVKSMFEEVKALFSCKSSSIPRSVSQPQRGRGSRGVRPPIVTSGRASSARPSGAATTGAGGSRSSGIQHVTAEVGDRRDTTLPLYTDSGPSEPSTTLGMYQDASHSDAWTAFMGQV